jgi:hypothetical protein
MLIYSHSVRNSATERPSLHFDDNGIDIVLAEG